LRGSALTLAPLTSPVAVGVPTGTAQAPVLVRRVTAASAVAAACGTAYGITGTPHTVVAWGKGAQGQIGDGHKATRVYPVPVIAAAPAIPRPWH
jgi:alpha-tubulin suppressor-like RCC1 family protein